MSHALPSRLRSAMAGFRSSPSGPRVRGARRLRRVRLGSNLMKIGTIEFGPDLMRAGAALTGAILLAVTISMSMAACSLFDSNSVRQTVVPRPAAKNADPYQIGSDDELEIVVWNQPQLSGKVIVASDGTIAMPLIGRVPATGLTPDLLKADLEKR